mgnify:CR=1 FL=1
MTVITRFAPSPTGFLHIGGARTALFNFLFSKSNNGKFLIRIEDTDRERWSQHAEDAIIEGLEWLKIDADEPPVSQYSRKDRHIEIAKKMLKEGSAYKCYLTQEEYQLQRADHEKTNNQTRFLSPFREKTISSKKPYTIRLKTPVCDQTTINDIVQGRVTWENKDLDDFILVRSNGDPTYMLSVVVDDYDMQISHIIRGDDHLTNAARQSLIFKANNWKVPGFAHISLLHGSDGSKLSKRHGALGIEHYKNEGFPSEAVINYLLGLGWHFPDKEIFSLDEASEKFKLENLNKAPAKFDMDKLSNISSIYIKNSKESDLSFWFQQLGTTQTDQFYYSNLLNKINKGMGLFKNRAKTLLNIIDDSFFMHCQPDQLKEKQSQISLSKVQITLVEKFLNQLPKGIWIKEKININLNGFLTDNKISLKDLGVPLRIILTGSKNAPGIIDILLLLGENEVRKRIVDYLKINNRQES